MLTHLYETLIGQTYPNSHFASTATLEEIATHCVSVLHLIALSEQWMKPLRNQSHHTLPQLIYKGGIRNHQPGMSPSTHNILSRAPVDLPPSFQPAPIIIIPATSHLTVTPMDFPISISETIHPVMTKKPINPLLLAPFGKYPPIIGKY